MSDSHRAEVEQQIMDILHKTYKHAETTYLLETVGTEAIMALLDSERERWIGEVRSRLPEKIGSGQRAGHDYVVDAVSRVLDELDK